MSLPRITFDVKGCVGLLLLAFPETLSLDSAREVTSLDPFHFSMLRVLKALNMEKRRGSGDIIPSGVQG